MTAAELRDDVLTRKMQVENLIASGKPVQKEREELKNVLFNNIHTILAALDGKATPVEVERLQAEIEELKAENETLDDALAEADAEIKALKLQAKEAKETKGKEEKK